MITDNHCPSSPTSNNLSVHGSAQIDYFLRVKSLYRWMMTNIVMDDKNDEMTKMTKIWMAKDSFPCLRLRIL